MSCISAHNWLASPEPQNTVPDFRLPIRWEYPKGCHLTNWRWYLTCSFLYAKWLKKEGKLLSILGMPSCYIYQYWASEFKRALKVASCCVTICFFKLCLGKAAAGKLSHVSVLHGIDCVRAQGKKEACSLLGKFILSASEGREYMFFTFLLFLDRIYFSCAHSQCLWWSFCFYCNSTTFFSDDSYHKSKGVNQRPYKDLVPFSKRMLRYHCVLIIVDYIVSYKWPEKCEVHEFRDYCCCH